MLSVFKKIIGSPSITADVVEGYLILSLLNAVEPIVWRVALDKIGNASFEIKKDDKSQAAKLILKPKKGTAEIIATFDNSQNAIHALTAASNALQRVAPQGPAHNKQASIQKNDATNGNKNATSKTTSVPQSKNLHSQSEAQKWIIAILGAFIVLGLYYYLTTLIPNTAIDFEDQTARTNFVSSTPQDSVGVPVSADDFLNGL